MQIGLKQLIEPGLKPLVHESKQFNEARKAAVQGKKQPDLTTSVGLQEARNARKPSGTLLDRQVVESIAEADGREVPVRIIQPKKAKPRGVYFSIGI